MNRVGYLIGWVAAGYVLAFAKWGYVHGKGR